LRVQRYSFSLNWQNISGDFLQNILANRKRAKKNILSIYAFLQQYQ